MQTQARQSFQLLARPLDAGWHEAPGRLHDCIGIGLAADAPEQALGLEAGAGASGTGGVTAVLGQQDPDVHLVGLGLQVLKEALDAKPVLLPFALPVRGAVDHPVLLLGRQLVPGGIAGNAFGFGMAHQVVLTLLPGRGLHRLDRASAQGELVVRDHQTVINANDPAKAATRFAGAHGRVEREHGRDRIRVTPVALRAMQAGGELPDLSVVRIHRQTTAAMLDRDLDRLQRSGTLNAVDSKAVGHHVEDETF